MKKNGKTKTKVKLPPEMKMRPHYDFSGGVRGKYYGRITLPITVHLISDEDDRRTNVKRLVTSVRPKLSKRTRSR